MDSYIYIYIYLREEEEIAIVVEKEKKGKRCGETFVSIVKYDETGRGGEVSIR